MSEKEYLERETQKLLVNNPYATHLTPQTQPDYWTRQTVNNEMDRIRREEEQRRRQSR